MDQVQQAEIDWTRWSPVRKSNNEVKGLVRLDILALRSSVNHLREEPVNLELRSKVEFLWNIGSNILWEYKYGCECIEMMGMLAYLNSTPLSFNVSEENRNLILMLKDIGFVIITNQSSISTEFPAFMEEIRQKNIPNSAKLLQKLFVLISGHSGRGSFQVMTPIWEHALTHGILFIRDNNAMWQEYLNSLLENNLHRLTTEEKQILIRAIEIFDVEYGITDKETMKLRLTLLCLFLREKDVGIFLNHSKYYRSALQHVLTTTHGLWERLLSGTNVQYTFRLRSGEMCPQKLQIVELILKRAAQMRDLISKTFLLEEALAYSVIGSNVWKSMIPGDHEDIFFRLRLESLVQLEKWDELVEFVREIREIIMGPEFPFAKPWFPSALLRLKGVGREMILNELSLILNHYFNNGGKDRIGSLINCESDLKNWDRILVVMRQERENWGQDVEGSVGLESFMLDTVKNSSNYHQFVNESLQFVKQVVKFFINDGVYGEKYLVNKSKMSGFRDDPLVFVITTCLMKNRHEELLSYMLEYEKLLEEKYVERMGPITNAILLFGEWFRGLLFKHKDITGGNFEELLQGIKAISQNRMSIVSNYPTEKKSWMQGYADLISRDCESHTYLNCISNSIQNLT